MRHFLLCCFALLCLAALPSRAHAAECTEITGPTTINAFGHYCLAADVVLDLTYSAAIAITADNVDLDCRGYSIRNSTDDEGGSSVGVSLYNHRNVSVRNCHIVGGFMAGIQANEDLIVPNLNRYLEFTNNTIAGANWYGIFAYGTDIEITGNRIYDIGGRNSFAMGIRVGGSTVSGQTHAYTVRDNVIRDVVSPVNNGYGIYANTAQESTFADNRITGTRAGGSYTDISIKMQQGGNNKITGNQVHGSGNANSIGIVGAASDACYDNFIRSHMLATAGCDSNLGNY